DLRIVDLPDAGTAGSALAPLAVAGRSGRARGARIRPACRAAAPALHQDAHAAGRDSLRPPGHLYRDGPASARCVRVDVPPKRNDWPPARTAAPRPARAPRTRWTTWTPRPARAPRTRRTTWTPRPARAPRTRRTTWPPRPAR